MKTGFLLTGVHDRIRCESCHIRGIFSETPQVCSGCHSRGGLIPASSKSSRHIQTESPCEQCHSTSRWNTLVRMDHTDVTGQCFKCHNGSSAKGKPSNHIQSGNNCEDCHSTRSWSGARFDHSSITSSCSSCHNGTTAKGKSSNHFVTSIQCNECHSTSAWVPTLAYRHSSGDYPGNHKSSVRCTGCHKGNTQSATWTNSTYKPDCAGCHAGNFKSGAHKKITTPTTYYTVSELRNCSGACHTYTNSTMTTIDKTRSGKHRSGDGGW